VNFRKFAYVQ